MSIKKCMSTIIAIVVCLVGLLQISCVSHLNLDAVQSDEYFILKSNIDDSVRISLFGDSQWQFITKEAQYNEQAINGGGLMKTLYLKANQEIAIVGVDSILFIESIHDNEMSHLDIDLSHLSKTMRLTIHHKGLNQLNISSMKYLRTLDCEHCNLSTLNLSANQNLVFLKCSDNNLTKLDVSKMYYLRQLMCSDNHLNSLNVANGINHLFYEPYCFAKTASYIQNLHYPYLNSEVNFPDVFPCFDARNNPNLKTIVVDYGFEHNMDEWLKDDQTEWDREIEDNRQKESDPFFKRHESAANSPFSKKSKEFMDVLATEDPHKIASLFEYPIRLMYPIENIKNEEMYVNEFDKIYANGELDRLLLLEPESFFDGGFHTNYFSSGITYKYAQTEYVINSMCSYFVNHPIVDHREIIPFAYFEGPNYSMTVHIYKDDKTGKSKFLMYIQDNEKSIKDKPLFYCDDVYYEKEYDEEHDGANEHIVFIGKDVSNDYLMIAAAFSKNNTEQFDYIDVKERATIEETVSSYSSMPEEFFKDVYGNFGKDILVNFASDKEHGFDF